MTYTRILISICTVFTCCSAGFSQNFVEHQSVALPDTLTHESLHWMDANNDGFLDIVLFSKNAAGEAIISLFRNDSLSGIQYVGHFNTGMKEGGHVLTDFNGDNMVDLVISGQYLGGPLTSVFLNKGNFIFQSESVVPISAQLIALGDFDEDGIREMILSGNDHGDPFLRIVKRQPSGWDVAHDSLKIEAKAIEIYNFDSDNDLDFFVSGVDHQGLPVGLAFYNHGDYYFQPLSVGSAVAGSTTCGDLNLDGQLDIVVFGKNASSANVLKTLINTGKTFMAKDSIISANDPQVFAADFNSDGKPELQLFGLLAGGDTLNVIADGSRVQTLPAAGVAAQVFGDDERDGDLDVVQLTRSTGDARLVILRNETDAKNAAPTLPTNVLSAKIFNRFFLRWNASSDDHTAVNSLTYDVALQSTAGDIVTPAFDLIGSRRLLVSHGNNTTARFSLLRRKEAGPFYFNIQAVDNAFHADKGSVCNGSGGGLNDCLLVETTELDACKHEQLTLTASSDAEWYSFEEGFLGQFHALSFNVSQPDTLFSVETQGPGCGSIKVYVIQTPATVKKTIESIRYVCEGEPLRAGVEPGWQKVLWSSSSKGVLSTADSINYIVAGADTLKVNVSDGGSCQIQRNTILKISKPEFELPSDAYQILRGESVQLHVSGGTSCEWRPASGLSDPTSFAPIASPLTTTEYQVSVTDSLGCTAVGRVTVIVEETAFVPSLFTPNNDGSNDFLKIYGLGQVKNFSFTILNREGSRVFHTDNISEVVNVGWNGTTGGIDQPVGLYYWNVKGETGNGKNLQLNGKFSGSIVLLR